LVYELALLDFEPLISQFQTFLTALIIGHLKNHCGIFRFYWQRFIS